jgi:methionine sulfoxide reductase heme-binding subunit
MVSFRKRVPTMPLSAAFLVPLLVVMALGLIAMTASLCRRPVAAG